MKLMLESSDPQALYTTPGNDASPFCHSFDLRKRLDISAVKGQLRTTPIGNVSARSSPLSSSILNFLAQVASAIKSAPCSVVHRIVIPNLLSPTVYAPSACRPEQFLRFLHILRALLRTFPQQLTAMISVPLSLHPRSTGLIRCGELLSDGVLELVPFHHENQIHVESGKGKEETTQGLLRVHSLPIFHERGGGPEGNWGREDLSFKLSTSNGLVVTPFHLPPVGIGEEQPKQPSKNSEAVEKNLDF